MGLFGGGNSSSSTTNNTYNTDRRIALDNASQGITGDNNTISVQASDYGAIAGAVGVSSGAVSAANESLLAALALAESATSQSLAAASRATSDAVKAVSSSNRDSLNFASSVNRDSLDLAARGQSMIATNAAESLKMVGSVVDLAFRSTDASSKRASDAGISAAGLVGRAYETATAYQAEKQTADSKYLVIAGLVAVALVAVKIFAKGA